MLQLFPGLELRESKDCDPLTLVTRKYSQLRFDAYRRVTRANFSNCILDRRSQQCKNQYSRVSLNERGRSVETMHQAWNVDEQNDKIVAIWSKICFKYLKFPDFFAYSMGKREVNFIFTFVIQ